MNDFKYKKIQNRVYRESLGGKAKHNLITALGILLLVLIIYYGGVQVFGKLSGTRLLGFFSEIFGKELQVDTENHTNILLLGVGGEGHEGKDLTDTMMIASLDQTDNSVSMLSIPRDLYVESNLGGSRINRLYEQGKLKWDSEQGLDFTRATVEKVLNVPIPYYVKVDFEAFEQIVDSLGGIDVYVDEAINDPLYPRDDTFEYETFILAQGQQHLGGKTALKYARSRKTSSDFDRSKRQQKVLIAMKNKAAEENMLSRTSMMKDIYYSLKAHIETNLSVREFLSLASFASKWNSHDLATATLNDEPSFRGGFLYTPLRELYGGAYVLLPAGDNYDSVRAFVRLLFYGPKNITSLPMSILNGTETSGMAATAKEILNRFGLQIGAIGNAVSAYDLESTTWYQVSPDAEPLIKFLQTLISGKTISQIPSEYIQNPKTANAKIILELGKDSVKIIDKLDIFKNIVLLKAPEGAGSSTDSTKKN